MARSETAPCASLGGLNASRLPRSHPRQTTPQARLWGPREGFFHSIHEGVTKPKKPPLLNFGLPSFWLMRKSAKTPLPHASVFWGWPIFAVTHGPPRNAKNGNFARSRWAVAALGKPFPEASMGDSCATLQVWGGWPNFWPPSWDPWIRQKFKVFPSAPWAAPAIGKPCNLLQQKGGW